MASRKSRTYIFITSISQHHLTNKHVIPCFLFHFCSLRRCTPAHVSLLCRSCVPSNFPLFYFVFHVFTLSIPFSIDFSYAFFNVLEPTTVGVDSSIRHSISSRFRLPAHSRDSLPQPIIVAENLIASDMNAWATLPRIEALDVIHHTLTGMEFRIIFSNFSGSCRWQRDYGSAWKYNFLGLRSQ